MLWSNRRQLREDTAHELNDLDQRYRVDLFVCGEPCLYCLIARDTPLPAAPAASVYTVSGGAHDGRRVHLVQQVVSADTMAHDRVRLVQLTDNLRQLCPRGTGLERIMQALEQPAEAEPVREALHLGAIASALSRLLADDTQTGPAQPPAFTATGLLSR